jgi:glycosyltransferase involved in cell wall biosynthesis
VTGRRSRLVHVTTTDMSLALLLGSQLQAFAAAGYDVVGVSAPGPYVARLDAWGIEHIPLRHATRAVAPRHDLLAYRELRRLFSQLDADIVHTHNPKPGIYGRFAARRARTPVIVNTVHGLYAQRDDGWLRRTIVYRLERLAARASHAELVQNEEDLETLEHLGVPRAKLHLLGNGIDLARFDPARIHSSQTDSSDSDAQAARVAAVRRELGVRPGDVVVGVVGRLVVEKGYREVFAAAAALRARRPEIRVVVIGPADDAKAGSIPPAELDQARRDSGVQVLGSRDDMEDLYAAMDVYVLASHREGFPRSAMEASAMGVPVIATDVRGCRQVVDHDVTGLLVPVRDADALGAAIESLSTDPARRAALGAAGRAKAVREFDEQRVIDRTLAVYDSLLQTRASRR